MSTIDASYASTRDLNIFSNIFVPTYVYDNNRGFIPQLNTYLQGDVNIGYSNTAYTLKLNGQPITNLSSGTYFGDYLRWNPSSLSWVVGSSTINLGASAGVTNQSDFAVALGYQAGLSGQGTTAIAIGRDAAKERQSPFSIAIGSAAGELFQGPDSIAIGYTAGKQDQSSASIAIGSIAGEYSQGAQSIAIGYTAGQFSQSLTSIAIGSGAGQTSQGENAIAIGKYAGYDSQRGNSILLNATGADFVNTAYRTTSGFYVAPVRLATTTLSTLYYDPSSKEITYGNAPSPGTTLSSGTYFGDYLRWNPTSNSWTVGSATINLGANAGALNQGISAVAIGSNAGSISQGQVSVAIGFNAASNSQGIAGIAVGSDSGRSNQGDFSIAIGSAAGEDNQGGIVIGGFPASIAIGYGAGRYDQKAATVALGFLAGNVNQQNNAIAIGTSAGCAANILGKNPAAGQGQCSVAVGALAGSGMNTSQGEYAVALGPYAGYCNQAPNSIILNASSGALNSTTSGFFVNPIRSISGPTLLYHNTTTKEITYNENLSVMSGTTNNVAGVNILSEFVSEFTGSTNWTWTTTSFNGATVFACVCGGSIYRSFDYGRDWQALSGGGLPVGATSNLWQGIAATPDGRIVYACTGDYVENPGSAGRGYIYKSDDAGQTWIQLGNDSNLPQPQATPMNATNPWTCVACSADGQIVIAGNVNHDVGYSYNVCLSKDGGARWYGISHLNSPPGYFNPTNGAFHGVAISGDGNTILLPSYVIPGRSAGALYLYKYALGTLPDQSWTHISQLVAPYGPIRDSTGVVTPGLDPTYGTTEWLSAALSYDGNIMYAVQAYSTFTSAPSPSATPPNTPAHYNGNLFKSTDRGTTWSRLVVPDLDSTDPNYEYVACSSDGQTVYVNVVGGSCYRSLNGGATWSPYKFTAPGNWTSLSCSTDGKNLLTSDFNKVNSVVGTPGINCSGGPVYISGIFVNTSGTVSNVNTIHTGSTKCEVGGVTLSGGTIFAPTISSGNTGGLPSLAYNTVTNEIVQRGVGQIVAYGSINTTGSGYALYKGCSAASNATGEYTVTFTTTLSDSRYAITYGSSDSTAGKHYYTTGRLAGSFTFSNTASAPLTMVDFTVIY